VAGGLDHGARHQKRGRRGEKKAQCLGRSRGGLTTKLHVVCDGAGTPLALHLSAGPRHDAPQFEPVCEQVRVRRRPRQLIADRGYDAQHIRRWLRRRRIRAVIPRRRLAPSRRCRRRGRPPRIEPRRYARRNVIERLFGSLKEHRRVATRYDKHDQHFLSMAQLACIRRILQHHFSDTA